MWNMKKNPISPAFCYFTEVYSTKKDEGTVQDVLDDLGLEVVDFSPTVRLFLSDLRGLWKAMRID